MESTESDSDFGSEDSFEESNTYTLLPSYDPDDPSSLGGKEEQLELPVNSFSEIDLDAAVLAQLAGSLPSFSPVNESRTRNERAPLDLLDFGFNPIDEFERRYQEELRSNPPSPREHVDLDPKISKFIQEFMASLENFFPPNDPDESI